jgi:zinc protease
MRHFPRVRFRLVAACVAGAACWLVLSVPAARAAIDIQKVTSPGGIEAWLVENHTLPIIAVDAGFHGGARLDPEGKAGLASLLSGLLDEGAGDLDSQAFQRRLAETSIRLGFDAGRDGFYASVRTLTDHRDEAFHMLGLALNEPRFDKEPVARVRAQMLSILAEQHEDPQQVAVKAWYAAAFPGQPYGRPVDGDDASIKAITRDDLVGFTKAYLTRKRLRVAVVGDIDAKTLGPLLDRTFGPLPADGPTPDLKMLPPDRPSGLTVIRADNPQTVILFGGAGLLRHDPDFIPAYVMNYILGGGGFSSRLMQQVREKRGLAYSVQTSLVPNDLAGLIVGYVGTENSRAARAVELIRAEFARMRDSGATAQELEDAKTYLTGAYPLRFDSNDDIADELLGIQMEDLGIDYVNKRNAMIRAVTLADVQRAAKRVLRPDHLLVVAVGQPVGLDKAATSAPTPAHDGKEDAAPPAANPPDAGVQPDTGAMTPDTAGADGIR